MSGIAKLTKDEWLAIKDKWSADPKLTYSDLTSEYGISRQAITLRAKKESWQKTGDLATINRAAVRKADGLSSPKVDSVDETPRLKGDDVAIDLRTDILVKHRGQIVDLDEMQGEAMSLFAEAMEARITADNAGDDQKVKTAKNLFWQAKIAADIVKDHCAAIKIKHAAEREWHGEWMRVIYRKLT